MGKKINPKIIRMGITRTWPSTWFSAGNDYIRQTRQDVLMRKYILKEFREAGVDRVEISRNSGKIAVDVYTAKPGIIIGRGGNGVEELKKNVHKKFLSNPMKIRLGDINVNIKEVENPNLSAQINVQSIALEIEKRVPFRKVMKQALSRVERAGALGVKIMVSGRLNGAEIARSEKLIFGKLPLSTLRANIDYARGVAHTTYGSIGVKVWVYKGEVFKQK
ncbi:30S ribosomal protein S3 [Candidatus Falkowbacteria bacterium HGW-Falkowbacteria-1]|uniref:Small ribosomal subunit protein uS3 n=1 Tax=Candidatus Falkowbacteria bacterium HGW-Falkowbacteria-1 TaxID=2013768 RepID=A0A2N2E953_9BACT|nr:MAG: 30S ribosomal protein S3 [Candidatus Falkowbacteria bacterium HGW-Falkowbacteria-1]